MQDIDAPPSLLRKSHRRCKRGFIGDIRLESHTLRALPCRQPGRFFGGTNIAVHGENLCTFLCKAHDGRASVADAFARTLTGTDNERDLSLKTHGKLPDIGAW